MIFRNKLKQILVFVLILAGLSLNSNAQNNLKFTYNCSMYVLNKPHVLVLLKDSNNKIELFVELSNDTILGFESCLNVPLNKNDYILSVQFENKIIGKETLDYPFTLKGNETDIEIDIYFSGKAYRDNRSKARIEIIKYYAANPNIEIQYLPELKVDEFFKGPFFLVKNNSDSTIYGVDLNNYLWGSISFLMDSMWSREFFGLTDYEFPRDMPLLPGLAKIAWVGSFGYVNELPQSRYKYTLLYKIDKNMHRGVDKYLEKDNFIWSAGTKEYYRLIYEFEVK